VLNSPCIDAGEDSFLPKDFADVDEDGDGDEAQPLDLDLEPRIHNSGGGFGSDFVDMGAYERQGGS
jgi:hypothetical protein